MLKQFQSRLNYNKIRLGLAASLSLMALPAIVSAGEFTLLHSGSQYGEILPCG